MSDSSLYLEERAEAAGLALETGQRLLAEATASHEAAQTDEHARRWLAAIAKYREAHKLYVQAAHVLELPIGLGETEFAALQIIRDTAQSARNQVNTALHLLEQEQRSERCEAKIKEAANLLAQAQAALDEGSWASARGFAEQAMEHDPALEENARRVINIADEESVGRSPARLIGLLLLLVIIVAVGWFVGPPLYRMSRDFLFPASAIVLSLLS